MLKLQQLVDSVEQMLTVRKPVVLREKKPSELQKIKIFDRSFSSLFTAQIFFLELSFWVNDFFEVLSPLDIERAPSRLAGAPAFRQRRQRDVETSTIVEPFSKRSK